MKKITNILDIFTVKVNKYIRHFRIKGWSLSLTRNVTLNIHITLHKQTELVEYLTLLLILFHIRIFLTIFVRRMVETIIMKQIQLWMKSGHCKPEVALEKLCHCSFFVFCIKTEVFFGYKIYEKLKNFHSPFYS